MIDMDTTWLQLLDRTYNKGAEVSPRDKKTRELLGDKLIVDMRKPVLTLARRKLGFKFMAAEAAWILSGDNRAETIVPYSKKMADFSDDGKTFFGAYGPRVQAQLQYAISSLNRDKTSRQAVINIWRENPRQTKDCPCTLSVQWLIRKGQLDCFVTMRSSDVWLGVPYDVFSFSMLSAYVLLHLKPDRYQLGNIHQMAVSRHLYETDFADVADCLSSPTVVVDYLPLDPYQFEQPDDLIKHLWCKAKQEETPYPWLKELL